MQVADHDKDGELTPDELSAVPGLRLTEALEDLDSDKNGRLSGKEIGDWLTALRGTKVALAPAAVGVRRRGQAVPGLRVQIVPEPCMGNTVQAAEGMTDANGIAMLRIASPPLGAHFGIYRVRVTGQAAARQPIAAKYNSESVIGLIVPLYGRVPQFEIDE